MLKREARAQFHKTAEVRIFTGQLSHIVNKTYFGVFL